MLWLSTSFVVWKICPHTGRTLGWMDLFRFLRLNFTSIPTGNSWLLRYLLWRRRYERPARIYNAYNGGLRLPAVVLLVDIWSWYAVSGTGRATSVKRKLWRRSIPNPCCVRFWQGCGSGAANHKLWHLKIYYKY